MLDSPHVQGKVNKMNKFNMFHLHWMVVVMLDSPQVQGQGTKIAKFNHHPRTAMILKVWMVLMANHHLRTVMILNMWMVLMANLHFRTLMNLMAKPSQVSHVGRWINFSMKSIVCDAGQCIYVLHVFLFSFLLLFGKGPS